MFMVSSWKTLFGILKKIHFKSQFQEKSTTKCPLFISFLQLLQANNQVYYQQQDKVQTIFCRLICPVLSLILGMAIQSKTVTRLFSKAVSSIGR